MKRELQGWALLILCCLALYGLVSVTQHFIPTPVGLFEGGSVGLLLASGRILNWLRA